MWFFYGRKSNMHNGQSLKIRLHFLMIHEDDEEEEEEEETVNWFPDEIQQSARDNFQGYLPRVLLTRKWMQFKGKK